MRSFRPRHHPSALIGRVDALILTASETPFVPSLRSGQALSLSKDESADDLSWFDRLTTNGGGRRRALATETAQITERYVTLSHGRTRYFEAGVGFPTLLLHGAGFDNGAYVWLPNLPSLAPRLRVLALDSLDWGPGDVLDIELSFAYLVDHVREFMDALGIERANVVGHSMGGWLATLFAYERPDRANKLVLVSAGGGAAGHPPPRGSRGAPPPPPPTPPT